MTLGGCVTQRLAGSSWSSVATKAGSEDVSVCCCPFHLMVKAPAFHWHARSCILFSKYPNQKSQIVPKGYKICSSSVLQKVDAFHHWETSKGCVQISHTEVARKRFLSSTSVQVWFTIVCAQGFALLESSSQQTFLLTAALRHQCMESQAGTTNNQHCRTRCSCRIITVAIIA